MENNIKDDLDFKKTRSPRQQIPSDLSSFLMFLGMHKILIIVALVIALIWMRTFYGPVIIFVLWGHLFIQWRKLTSQQETNKFDWRVFLLSTVVYYSVVVWLSIIIITLGSSMDRIYKILIALAVSLYFYQIRKQKTDLKKDAIWVGVVGLITAIVLIFSY